MNNDEIKEILQRQEEILELARKLWKAEKWRRYWAILKYAVIILIIIGGFYFLQPYLGRLGSLLQNVINIQRTLQQNPQELQKLLQQSQLQK